MVMWVGEGDHESPITPTSGFILPSNTHDVNQRRLDDLLTGFCIDIRDGGVCSEPLSYGQLRIILMNKGPLTHRLVVVLFDMETKRWSFTNAMSIQSIQSIPNHHGVVIPALAVLLPARAPEGVCTGDCRSPTPFVYATYHEYQKALCARDGDVTRVLRGFFSSRSSDPAITIKGRMTPHIRIPQVLDHNTTYRMAAQIAAEIERIALAIDGQFVKARAHAIILELVARHDGRITSVSRCVLSECMRQAPAELARLIMRIHAVFGIQLLDRVIVEWVPHFLMTTHRTFMSSKGIELTSTNINSEHYDKWAVWYKRWMDGFEAVKGNSSSSDDNDDDDNADNNADDKVLMGKLFYECSMVRDSFNKFIKADFLSTELVDRDFVCTSKFYHLLKKLYDTCRPKALMDMPITPSFFSPTAQHFAGGITFAPTHPLHGWNTTMAPLMALAVRDDQVLINALQGISDNASSHITTEEHDMSSVNATHDADTLVDYFGAVRVVMQSYLG